MSCTPVEFHAAMYRLEQRHGVYLYVECGERLALDSGKLGWFYCAQIESLTGNEAWFFSGHVSSLGVAVRRVAAFLAGLNRGW